MAQIEIDNRGLSPPEPMVRILEALERLPEGGEVIALMDREPLLLYPELERRGYTWEFTNRNGEFVISIRQDRA